MLRRLRSECLINLQIDTDGPLLIKSGQTFATGIDMTAVRTLRNGRWEVYIPGSSLKGALRSHAERFARTLAVTAPGCCDTFPDADAAAGEIKSCSDDLLDYRKSQGDKISPQTIYTRSCPICKLFGSLSMAGRLAFNDAHLISTDIGARVRSQEGRRKEELRQFARQLIECSKDRNLTNQEIEQFAGEFLEDRRETITREIEKLVAPLSQPGASDVVIRDGIGINRRTGGTQSGALFQLEAVTAASFATSLYLRNVELWQLGLLGFVLRDMEEGLIKLGLGKSRGMGLITAQVANLEINYLGLNPQPQAGEACVLRGMKQLEPQVDYGFSDSEATSPCSLQSTVAQPDEFGIRTRYNFANAEQRQELFNAVAPYWVDYARCNTSWWEHRTGGGQ